MTTSPQDEIFDLIGRILELKPNLRLGQLIGNSVMYANLGEYIPSVGNIEDDELVVALGNYLSSSEKCRAEALERTEELELALT